ncbi:MAG TPA: hypothetical protein VIY27_05795 [Myxococcota bacterium]
MVVSLLLDAVVAYVTTAQGLGDPSSHSPLLTGAFAFLSGRAEYCLPFLCGALVLMYRHRPTDPELNPASPGRGTPPSPPPIG